MHLHDTHPIVHRYGPDFGYQEYTPTPTRKAAEKLAFRAANPVPPAALKKVRQ